MWYRSAKSCRLKMSDFRKCLPVDLRGIPTPVCALAWNDRKSVGRAWNNGGTVVAPEFAVRLHREVFCTEFNFSISES